MASGISSAFSLPIFLISLKIALNAVGFFLNLLLLWIFIKTFRTLDKSLLVFLIYTLINDLLISVTVIFMVKRLLICHETIAVIYYGPCKHISPSFCQFLNGVYFHCLQNWILSQILLIIFRTTLLSTSSTSFNNVKRSIVLCIFAYLPGFLTLIYHIHYIGKYSIKILIPLVEKCYNEDLPKLSIAGFIDYHSSPIAVSVMFMILANFPHYLLFFCFLRKQNKALKRITLSSNSIRMHNTLRKVSNLKAFLPLIILIDIAIFLGCQHNILPSQISEYFLGTMISSVNILNPLIAIRCFKPCRTLLKNYYSSIISRFKTQQNVIFTENDEEIASL